MFLSSLFFLAGIVLVQSGSDLPDTLEVSAFVLFSGLTVFAARYYRQVLLTRVLQYLFIVSVGFNWAVFSANHSLVHRLPEALAAKNIKVQGVIAGIPDNGQRVKQFVLNVQSFEPEIPASVSAPASMPRSIRLSWYNSKKQPAMDVHAGESWQFLVRLKPPHGFYNPGGFDYEGWLFQQGIDATGYIRRNRQDNGWSNHRLKSAPWYAIDAWRENFSQRLRQWLDPSVQQASDSEAEARVTAKDVALPPKKTNAMTGLITALAVGDRRSISPSQWQALINTGTNHLMAISGLHIGLAYLFGMTTVRRIFARVVPAVWLYRIPAAHAGVIAGCGFAIIYALLAGFSIPTQRALLMLGAFALASLIRRHFRSVDALGLALVLVLLLDPLSVLSPGFWFSFIAVAVIFYAFMDNKKSVFFQQKPVHTESFSAGLPLSDKFSDLTVKLVCWARLQTILTLALLPLSLYLFQQGSLVSPLANLMLVPFVSFLVVPFVLLALLAYPLLPQLSYYSIDFSAKMMELAWPLIETIANLPFALINSGTIAFWQLLCFAVALLVLLLPGEIFKRYLSTTLRVPVVIVFLLPLPGGLLLHTAGQKPEFGAIKLTVLDVGQGLSTVVQTQSHTLVFDTGARTGRTLDAGRSVVVPFLRKNGIQQLDKLVISHGDTDHIGGAVSVLEAYPPEQLVGQDIDSLVYSSKSACYAGQHWQWDGVDFLFLSPAEPAAGSLEKRVRHHRYSRGHARNNRSCVLRIESPAGAILLTGDIEKEIEKQLVEAGRDKLASTVLVVPHHGSNTSSGEAFIRAVNPALAIVPVGYRNRYHLPGKKVVSRYLEHSIKLLYTGLEGAISVVLTPESGISAIDSYRRSHHHYWNRVFDNKSAINQVR